MRLFSTLFASAAALAGTLLLAPAAHAICGDGRLERGEACDDGNTANGDGCASTCGHEWGFTCDGNLVQNGEFEQDYAGFTTDYPMDTAPLTAHVACSQRPVPRAGRSLVRTQPYRLCACPSGKCFTADVGTAAVNGPLLWSQRVSVAPSTPYVVGFKHASRNGTAIRVVVKKVGAATELLRTAVSGYDTQSQTPGDAFLSFTTDAGATAVDVRFEVFGAREFTVDGIFVKKARTTCTIDCGNGSVYGTKQCDDGNTTSGDGCGAACQLEPGFTCTTPEVFRNGAMDQTPPAFTSALPPDPTPVAAACGSRATSSPRPGFYRHTSAAGITCGCDQVFGMCLAFERDTHGVLTSAPHGLYGLELFRSTLALRANTLYALSMRYATKSSPVGANDPHINLRVRAPHGTPLAVGESPVETPVRFRTLQGAFRTGTTETSVPVYVQIPVGSDARQVVLDSISVRGGPSVCRPQTLEAPATKM